ncbi:uncharacterized protein Z518_10715 [Rhinocladiella mackenziei CBS 650.93]|uniref:Uncharacterized protein n=1 Tax=Rhinocladiella mackenziei CBS 650.93 TaxID=1442369 RepID=A0A0D2GN25_9EURO|nr:uncharacterized protein Z518_10715 [Rhinocladiella mackenziei CBS 650.93]KIW99787.1 hypothetical protein Z518_10715 [Rhinocladiella mackenziei CBS 650.93]
MVLLAVTLTEVVVAAPERKVVQSKLLEPVAELDNHTWNGLTVMLVLVVSVSDPGISDAIEDVASVIFDVMQMAVVTPVLIVTVVETDAGFEEFEMYGLAAGDDVV